MMNEAKKFKQIAKDAARFDVRQTARDVAVIVAFDKAGRRIGSCEHYSRINAPMYVESHGDGMMASNKFWDDSHARSWIREQRAKGQRRFRILIECGDITVAKRSFTLA